MSEWLVRETTKTPALHMQCQTEREMKCLCCVGKGKHEETKRGEEQEMNEIKNRFQSTLKPKIERGG